MWGQIHWCQVLKSSLGTPDAHGRGGVTLTTVEVKGFLSLIDASELDAADRFAQMSHAVFQCDTGTNVTPEDQFLAAPFRLDGVTPTNIPAQLLGSYKIQAVRRPPIILRVMLRRNT